MFRKPSAALMTALRNFVLRHEVFVEACEFDDGLIFVRQLERRSKRLGPRRHFEVYLRRNRRRIRFYSLTCGSEDLGRSQVSIAFPEKTLLRSAEAALEYEACGRDVKSYTARFPRDAEAGRALFGYVRSESRLLQRLLGGSGYQELIRLVRRHHGKSMILATKRIAATPSGRRP